MNEDQISRFCKFLPSQFLRRSNSDYVIIATPYLRAEFGRDWVDVVYTGDQKERYTEVDFEERYVSMMQRHIRYAASGHKTMSAALKKRYALMRLHLGFNTFPLHGTDGHRLTLTIGDSRTEEALAVLHTNDYKGEVFINMIGPHLDVHTPVRVAYNKSAP